MVCRRNRNSPLSCLSIFKTITNMNKNEIVSPENIVYKKPKLMNDNEMHYCPGCSHGVVHKIIAEVIEELGLEDKTIGIAPVGCAVFAYNYIDIDWVEAAHGRAPAVATAIKRLNPDKMVFTYQGDGDLAAIGTAETIHACNRGENIAIVFINNAIYGMTGGQMAPTTLPDMITSTTPRGRDVRMTGNPIKILDMLVQLDGVCFATRHSVHTASAVKKAKKAIKHAFENAMAGKGTSIVEIVSTCNAGWKMTPVEANNWMVENMFPAYPLGDLKNV
jgi:2-oxoglutarate ferredoxin oxidoreductase subunit beta